MKKRKFSILFRIINAVILFCVFCTAVFTVGKVWAKYHEENNAGDGATVAYFSPSFVSERVIDISGITLGNRVENAFQVQNFTGDDKVSEVAIKYKIVLKTTGNLPLKFTLLNGENPVLERSCDGVSGGQTYTYESSDLFRPNTREAHNYTLQVEWPSLQNGAQFAGKTDAVYLSVVWEQMD